MVSIMKTHEAKSKALDDILKAIHEGLDLMEKTGLDRDEMMKFFLIPNILDNTMPVEALLGIKQYFFNTGQIKQFKLLSEIE